MLDNLGINELAIFEMEQREQLTEDYKVRYTDINLLLAIRAAAEDKEIDWYDDSSILKVAGELQHVMRNNPGYAIVQLYAIKYMDAYLDDLGETGRYDKLIGTIERFREVGKTMRTVENNDPDRATAMLDVLFAAVSAGLKYQEVRQIRRLFNDDRDEFDKVVESIRNTEEQWEQPAGEEALVNRKRSTRKLMTQIRPRNYLSLPVPWLPTILSMRSRAFLTMPSTDTSQGRLRMS